ncbi:Peptidase A1 domain-containing protein [Psidium guajava]|nr:Peptidase A1 domain-containing protein [Psidium guajava]
MASAAGFLIAVVALASAVAVCGGFPAAMTLERAFPVRGHVEMSQLIARDRARHGRMLQSSTGVVDFPVEGTFNPFVVGLYYTKVQLGNPAKDYYVQIDTGSDVLWVSCSSCSGCPGKSGLPIQLNSFDPSSSKTASMISCSDKLCVQGVQSSDSGCSSQKNSCSFSFQYGDGSGASGYYVSDQFHFDTVFGGSQAANSSASVVFGCGTAVSGELTKTDRAVAGIFGFGQQSMSVISQLASQGVTPKVFSHCLSGAGNGGGILVLGEIVEPNIVYSPLVPSQPHYNLNLLSISVGGQQLAIDSSVFSTSSSQGTIIDSGTTLAYLAEGAYDHFVTAIADAVSQTAQTYPAQGNNCFLITSSVADAFPQVSLNFEGGASMVLSAEEYMLQQQSGGTEVWCIGFSKVQGQDITILGDLVLQNKIVVYDLAGQRIGWANYDCSLSVNVSTTSNTGTSEYVNAGQLSDNSSPRSMPYQSLPQVMTLMVGILLFL